MCHLLYRSAWCSASCWYYCLSTTWVGVFQLQPEVGHTVVDFYVVFYRYYVLQSKDSSSFSSTIMICLLRYYFVIAFQDSLEFSRFLWLNFHDHESVIAHCAVLDCWRGTPLKNFIFLLCSFFFNFSVRSSQFFQFFKLCCC